MVRLWFLILQAALLTGCAATPFAERVSQDERDWLLSGAALLGEDPGAPDLPTEDVFSINDDMRRLVQFAAAGYSSERGKIIGLLNAVMQPYQLGFKYDAAATYTAEEAFRRGRGNCLSFTVMIVALARQVGLKASFNEVDVPPIWDLHGENTLVLYKHVNAIVDLRDGSREIVDVNMEEYDRSFQQRTIPDRAAAAQYFNNRAMEFLKEQNFPEALRFLIQAITLEPHASYLWGNLGSLYRRAGKLHAADLAYRTALEEDPGDLVAISNAARLQTDLGNEETARLLRDKANYFRLRNPYYRYKLAQDAFLSKDYASAREHLEIAIRRYPQEHRFHFLLGAVYQRLGDQDRATASMNRALELTTDEAQVSKYRSKMNLLQSASLQ